MRTVQAHILLVHGKGATVELALRLAQLFRLHRPDDLLLFWDNYSVLSLLDRFRLYSAILTTAHFS